MSITYQPLPNRIAQAPRQKGLDLINFNDNANRLISEINYSLIPKSECGWMSDVIEATCIGVRDRVVDLRGLFHIYFHPFVLF